jgi:hypothetical protein
VTDPDQPRTDPVVDRVNELTTTFLDMVAALAVVAGCGYAVWTAYGPAWGLIVAGVVLTVLSALAQLRSRPRTVKPSRAGPAEVPGPSDPGVLHIAGGR